MKNLLLILCLIFAFIPGHANANEKHPTFYGILKRGDNNKFPEKAKIRIDDIDRFLFATASKRQKVDEKVTCIKNTEDNDINFRVTVTCDHAIKGKAINVYMMSVWSSWKRGDQVISILSFYIDDNLKRDNPGLVVVYSYMGVVLDDDIYEIDINFQ